MGAPQMNMDSGLMPSAAIEAGRMTWDPVWIAAQEGCEVGDAAVRSQRFVQQLRQVAVRAIGEVSRQPCQQGNTELDRYYCRLWICVDYHWHRFAAKGPLPFADVIRRLENGSLAHGSYRGNLLEEIVLAVALERNEEQAARRFEADYMPTVRSTAGRLGGPRAVDVVDNFLAELILPRNDRPPKIASFQGRTMLAHWLIPVVSNCWRAMFRQKRSLPLTKAAEPMARSEADTFLTNPDCLGLLKPILESTMQTIDSEDRLLLQMLMLDGVPQKELAKTLKIHTGTLTRRRQRAAGLIKSRLVELVRQATRPRQVEECLRIALAGDDATLRDHLANTLAMRVRGT